MQRKPRDIFSEEDLSSGVSSASLVNCVTLDNNLNLSESMTDYPEYNEQSWNTMGAPGNGRQMDVKTLCSEESSRGVWLKCEHKVRCAQTVLKRPETSQGWRSPR